MLRRRRLKPIRKYDGQRTRAPWQYLVMPAYTGPSKRARSVGVSPDPLGGKNPHAILLLRTAHGWKAWCACRPAQRSKVHVDSSEAIAEVRKGHIPPDSTIGLFPLALVKTDDGNLVLWRAECSCTWRSKWVAYQDLAEEGGLSHWIRSHESSRLQSDVRPSPGGDGIPHPIRQSMFFRAWVRRNQDKWQLEEKGGEVIAARFDVSNQILAKLADTYAEFKIMSTAADGTPIVEPYFSNKGTLAKEVERAMKRERRR